ncbi:MULTISPECIES: holo-ACP synthase [unclassified Corynebacterium]|uniref:holo-ACP synthase AcpS n=1 Tax=unclassified Corynebacterium TaxID=2624378 RepID=UPI00163D75DE|nr:MULTISPECIES: holo-ACP synthase [unclassified Corynebacterium]
MSVFVGTDIVHIPAFAEQLAMPGSHFAKVFSPLELRLAAQKPQREESLAGKWAAKEAFVKAWSQSRFGQKPLLSQIDWAQITVTNDAYGRTLIRLSKQLAQVSGIDQAQVSISHDGEYAMAVCVLELAEH